MRDADHGRRRLLAAIAAGLPLAAARAAGMDGVDMPGMGATAPAPAAAFERPLPIPAELHGVPQDDGSLAYALRMHGGVSELVAGVRTPSWGYNGAFLGPALRVPRGREVAIRVRNALNQPSTTHWHGALVPGAADGGPQHPIAPGREAVARFTLEQPAATLWFHPHPDGLTGAHVWAGLAGLLLVDDGADAALGLPRQWGVDDVPLVLQDRRLDAAGRLVYLPTEADRMGMKGDRFLVNGCERPHALLPAQRVRLRILNGSNARIYNLGFADDRGFDVIAGDAGLLARPVGATRLLLSPGERAEIVVDLSGLQGRALLLRSDSGAVVPGLSSMPADADAADRAGFDLLQIRVGAPTGAPGALPAALVDLDRPFDVDHAPRRFSLQGSEDAMASGGGMADMASMPGAGGMSAMPGMSGAPLRGMRSGPGGMSVGAGMARLFSINHQFMDPAVINQRVAVGTTEAWEISNGAGMAHPFHMHGTSFRIVARDGLPPDEFESGWKDVVLVRRDETVRLVAKFSHRAADDRPYMYHCHILEHEDNGMMGQFTVA